jgi:hypothetical protein
MAKLRQSLSGEELNLFFPLRPMRNHELEPDMLDAHAAKFVQRFGDLRDVSF